MNGSDTVFYRRRGLAFHFKTLYLRNYWTSDGEMSLMEFYRTTITYFREYVVLKSALSARAFALRLESTAPVGGSINVCQCLTQGLRPGLCRSIALAGLIDIFIKCLLIGVCLPSRSPKSNAWFCGCACPTRSGTSRSGQKYGLVHNLWTSPLT